jgi:hypothetical protein
MQKLCGKKGEGEGADARSLLRLRGKRALAPHQLMVADRKMYGKRRRCAGSVRVEAETG